MKDAIPKSWQNILKSEFPLPYFVSLSQTIENAYLGSAPIYPKAQHMFHAFELCSFDDLKVVILGQDPYHGRDQAHGLSFSVPEGIKIPPSLKNIHKELSTDLSIPLPAYGNLEHWGTQGVLLLNSTLTVEDGKPGSHQGLGWETFTDAVIQKISDEKEHVVFLLWGKYARSKAVLIDDTKHLVLQAPHPSPLSAYTGFFGCKHFSKTNKYLTRHNLAPISW